MTFYWLLTISTVAIALLGWGIWVKTRNLAFPVGLFVMYFWSLYGGWDIVADRTVGGTHTNFQYLYGKLFLINLDANYFWSLIYYSLFICVAAAVPLWFAKPASVSSAWSSEPIRISHSTIIFITAAAGLLSVLLMREALTTAMHMNISAYSVSSNLYREHSTVFVGHQILNRVALIPATIGVAVWASGPSAFYMVGSQRLRELVGYGFVLGVMYIFCMLMGNKNELMVSLTIGFLFYLKNTPKPRIKCLVLVSTTLFSTIAYTNIIRGYDFRSIPDNLSAKMWIYSLIDIFSSTESKAAHFSMYGALEFNIPLTYGSSLVNAVYSVIPRFIWPDRPYDIYHHYIAHVGAVSGQGYTVHHATGWYLNFGVLGIILGALLLGGIWTQLYNNLQRLGNHGKPYGICLQIFTVIAFFAFTGGILNLIRGGPEAYKGMIINSFLSPLVVLTLASVRRRRNARGSVPSALHVQGRGAFGNSYAARNRS